MVGLERSVHISAEGTRLEGNWVIPENALGLVLFAHGSGSSRLSPRNNYVAQVLRDGGIATLLFDLLTEEEDRVYATRFDIGLLSERLALATRWTQRQPEAAGLPLGYFGASTGAAAALRAAAQFGDAIAAVVSRGGRPDLTGPAISRVTAPTLLIVGGLDDVVIGMNETAYAELRAEKQMVIVPGATHLFEEPGTLEEAASLALAWFQRHFKK
ncbi:alpha/beta hydrolase [Acidithiobacillus sp. 'AMD consortium']|jgi:dienelactone hydrolase|uniref:Phosphoribosyl transferase n=3 Tax=Acidithiobacillus ferridurans TaxID=1232575 RepID=A0A2Z6IFD3_ACIFI|nr:MULTISPECIES: dienelactone hydrolase family protein [Acidithiobacillus]MBU2716622.1 alpha/beta hydrolase [Acidithiobacillus ferridurans]MBU2723257.1 alpha/beta hydrolase [Acidithiobacillus ferridurans]MBU2804622.1 alpha/beta hydrolase [Acidithiobacillus ferridurans]QFG78762.1 alpha/beta hydrolase [Acidithiobacillus sp. 'AMD consortium']RBM03222.1 hydrolase [Acidithiobacillus ferridurans]